MNETTSKRFGTANQAIILLIFGSIFSLLSLNRPDAQLITDSSRSLVPFFGIDTGAFTFILVTPALSLFLYWYFLGHICIAKMADPGSDFQDTENWHLVVFLNSQAPKIFQALSGCLVFWSGPVFIILIWWRCLVIHSWLISITQLIMALLAFVGAIYLRKILGLRIYWYGIFQLIVIMVCLGIMGVGFSGWKNAKILPIHLVVDHQNFSNLPPKWEDGNFRERSATLLQRQLAGKNFNFARFRDSDFTGIHISKSQLDYTDMSGANLRYSRLDGIQGNKLCLDLANLHEARFLSVILPHLSLKNADLSSSKIKFSILSYATISNSDLTRASIRESTFEGAYFEGLELQEAEFKDSCISKTTIFCTDFSDTEFENTNIIHSQIISAKFDGTKFRMGEFQRNLFQECLFRDIFLGTTIFNYSIFEKCEFQFSDFGDSKLANASFIGATFFKTSFKGLVVCTWDFSTATFEDLTFREESLLKSNFTDSQFLNVTFESSNLTDSDFTLAHFKRVRFINSFLLKTNFFMARFEDAYLSGMHFNETDFSFARFIQGTIRDSSFAGAVLKGTIFDGVKLENVDFSDVDLSKTKGLTREVLAKCIINEKTILPEDLSSPLK